MKIWRSIPLGLCLALPGGVAYAQAPPPITSSGLNTQVSAPVSLPGGAVQHNITGGTRPGGGDNLFHSFGEFGVPTDNIANFLNDAALPTTNILSRVTGGHPSNIFGTIQTEGFGNTNLFLMNPAGIVFGSNASLNVGGATHFTTADYLKLSDGVQFTALPGAQDALLSVAPVAAFGFLESNPAPISVEGSTLSVLDGQMLSLVGGDLTIGSGLNAPGGQIALASVASPGEVLAGTYASFPNINGQSFTMMGSVTLSEGATLNVFGDAAGTVIIRGGRLVMTDARISADTENQNGATTAIDIQVTGDMSIADTLGLPALTAQATGAGDAGEVKISSNNLDATSSSLDLFFSLIDTHTSGSGTGGQVSITTPGELNVTGNPTGQMFFIDTGTRGDGGGHGGAISIAAGNIQLENTSINSGDFIARQLDFALGSGGDVTIIADTLQMTRSLIASDGFFEGKAGDLTISARNIQLENFSQLSLQEFGGGGVLTITADRLIADNSQIELETVGGRGAGISWPGVTINANIVELQNGSAVRSQTVGDGNAGDIHITASDHVLFSDDSLALGTENRPSGLFTNSQGNAGLGDQGLSGTITIETAKLEISGGARIDSTTQSSGRGGDVTIAVTDSIFLTGQRTIPVLSDQLFGLGTSLSSGVFARTVGSEFCTGPCGNAGNISMTTGSLNVNDGAAINTGTTNNGVGGIITVNATNNISIAGTLDDGTSGGVFSRTTGTEPGSGAGGAIALTAGQNFILSDGATVSASSDGPGIAGNITMTGHDTILIDKAIVTTEATQASGGEIKLTANDRIQLVDSTIESTVKGDAKTVAGNIGLDPDFIILQNSHILAKAVDGQGGNITLIAIKGVLVDAQSTLEVTSERGVSGTVNIESPIQVLSGTIVPLPDQPVNVATLYASSCVAGEGGHFSTFVDSKSDSVAPTPGTFLASPVLPITDPSQHAMGPNKQAVTSEMNLSGHEAAIHLAAYTPPVLFAQASGQPVPCP
ncbi:two-partner secretion domain-containing protein [Candidatus Nitrospira neomarina]|uniref:Filamentous hemagglutinin N-terminal domain-containing protein n=1 Tax=Candidatus Nitrospira neomarina TaxID=3020899 RepID=A0AA96GI62_9BACT|nr:filamentous hemagglutinin N-terminal domain-containing protein [Candidatus Nitrospira neomarina]WNM60745.1 filamentous hemagglutinin N-terminal domain-containing protein [Candidatus Nitrospira neomarina]